MKKYIITLSKVFPQYHTRKGESTFFADKFAAGQALYDLQTTIDQMPNRLKENNVFLSETRTTGNANSKLHTIRANYDLWRNRIDAINRGTHELHIRQWSGRPYGSVQEELCVLGAGQVGYQRIKMFYRLDADRLTATIDGMPVSDFEALAHNDGLLYDDWFWWFFGEQITAVRRKYKNLPIANIPPEHRTFTFDGIIIHFTPFRYQL